MCQKTEEERVSETERAHVQYTYPQSEVNVVAANFYCKIIYGIADQVMGSCYHSFTLTDKTREVQNFGYNGSFFKGTSSAPLNGQ